MLEDGNEDLYLEADDTTLNGYGDGAFQGYGIESLYMGRNLSYETFASAGYAPFRYLHWLKELTIGKFVTKIGSKLFSNSEEIEVITCLASTPPVLAKDIFTNEKYINITLYVPQSALAAYQAADNWKNFWDIRAVETAGIESVETISENKPAVIYDLQGRKLSEPQRGINIINGKKILVK